MTTHRCARCGTELPATALACPACGALTHAEHLKQLAAEAEQAAQAGHLENARQHWMAALQLLPPTAPQCAAVQARIENLTHRIDATPALGGSAAPSERAPWWRRGGAAAVTVAVLLFTKLKFVLLGLTKASTFFSLFAFVGVYWSLYGWPLALGLGVSIYIHEMGHVAMLRRLGIDAGAPLFIPGIGAMVMLKQHIRDPLVDARIGLAGPVWGLGAALLALATYAVTGEAIWLALAELTGFLNLFNLIPVWQLDGARGFHALSRHERWIVVAVVAVAFLLTGQRLLVVVGAVAAWRSLQRETGPGSSQVLATFIVLVVALSLLARGVG